MHLNRKQLGLSDVISALIMITVSVLIATILTYYSINTTTTRTSIEFIQLDKEHIWVNETGAVAAFSVKLIGGKDVLISKIEVRKIKSLWSNVYYFRVPSGTEIGEDMNLTSSSSLTGSGVSLFGRTYTQALQVIEMVSGGEILFYIKNPGDIGIDDIGSRADIKIFTNNAKYVTGKNIESATTQ